MHADLSDDDRKIITLARSARARLGRPEAAAVLDDTGRTYVATNVALPSLSLSAIQAVVAAAVSAGAERIDAVAVVTDSSVPGPPAPADLAAIKDLSGDSTYLLVAAPDGELRRRTPLR